MSPVPRYIDQGRNPQLYTKECLERALAKNEQVKGKIDTMKVRLLDTGHSAGHEEVPAKPVWLLDWTCPPRCLRNTSCLGIAQLGFLHCVMGHK